MNKSQAKIFFAILSVTFVSRLLEVVSPTLQSMGSALNVPYNSLMLLLTIPVVVSVPVALLVGFVAGDILKFRTVLSAGLLLMAIGGMAPFWLRDWRMILVSRGMFGFGQGIIMPLVLALIFSLVAPEKQATMMGMQNAVAGIAGMILSAVAGILAAMSWSFPFLLNATTIVSLIIVLVFLPEPQNRGTLAGGPRANTPKPSSRLPPGLWIYVILTFVYAILIFPSMGNISIVFHQLGLSPALAGIALTFLTGGAMLAGLIFGRVFTWLGLKTISIGFAAACVSQLLYGVGTSFGSFAIGAFLLGFGALGLAFAGLCMAAGKSVTPEKSSQVMSITMTGMNVGTFVSPIMFSSLMQAAGINSMRFPYWTSAICFATLTVLALFVKQVCPAQTGPLEPASTH